MSHLLVKNVLTISNDSIFLNNPPGSVPIRPNETTVSGKQEQFRGKWVTLNIYFLKGYASIWKYKLPKFYIFIFTFYVHILFHIIYIFIFWKLCHIPKAKKYPHISDVIYKYLKCALFLISFIVFNTWHFIPISRNRCLMH